MERRVFAPYVLGMAWTEKTFPDQTGRLAIVTGSNTGLGYDTARVLAARGAEVVMAVRDTNKGDAAAARIRQLSPARRSPCTVGPGPAGLGQTGRRRTGRGVPACRPADQQRRGDARPSPPPPTASELQFGTNHLGHFALTGCCWATCCRSTARGSWWWPASRNIRAKIDFDDLQWEKRKYDRVASYGQSKLSNLMFAYDLQRRLAAAKAKTIAVAAHPAWRPPS